MSGGLVERLSGEDVIAVVRKLGAELASEELLAARIRCLESHDDTDDMDTGCLALLELEAALDAEERLP